MALTPDLVFFLLMSRMLAAASSFSSSSAYPSLSFLPPFLSLLGSYSDYVEINISLNDSFSLLFPNVYAPPIRSSTKDSRTNFFSLHSSLLCGSGSGGFFALPLPQKKYRFHRFRFPLPLPHPWLLQNVHSILILLSNHFLIYNLVFSPKLDMCFLLARRVPTR